MADDIERAELLAAWRDTIQAADLAERLAAAAIEAAQQADLRSETADEIAELADRAAESAVRAAERARTAAEEAARLALLARERAPERQRMADQAREAEVDAGGVPPHRGLKPTVMTHEHRETELQQGSPRSTRRRAPPNAGWSVAWRADGDPSIEKHVAREQELEEAVAAWVDLIDWFRRSRPGPPAPFVPPRAWRARKLAAREVATSSGQAATRPDLWKECSRATGGRW